MSRKFLTPIVLPADPATAMEAATKQYVDTNAGSEVFIGTADPIASAPGTELWYDTDEPAVLTNDYRWNTAWGFIGFGIHSANYQPPVVATFYDVSGLSVTWTAVAGRRYKTTVSTITQKTVAAGDLFVRLADAGGVHLTGASESLTPGQYGSLNVEYVESPSAGSVTRKVQFYTSTLVGQISAGAAYPATITVEDVGPVAGALPAAQPSGPLGTVAFAQITANSAAITAVTDVGGMAVNFTAVAGRRYRTSVNAVWLGGAANDLIIAQITDGAGAVKYMQHEMIPPGFYTQLACSVVETGLTGAIQRKLQHYRYSGTGTSQILAGTTYPAYIMVEDLGAV